MKPVTVITIGILLGAVDGAGIFFDPLEPYPVWILFAAILNSILVCLIIALSLQPQCSWKHGLGYGLLYGFLFSVVVFLAKGGFTSMNAPYVVPSGIIVGGAAGILVQKFGFHD